MLRNFRVIPRFDANPRVVSFARTSAGRVLLLATVALLFYINDFDFWLELTLMLAAFTFLPRFRRLLLLAATLYAAFRFGGLDWSAVNTMGAKTALTAMTGSMVFKGGVLGAVFLFCGLYTRFAPRGGALALLLAGYLLLLGGLSSLVLSGPYVVTAWAFVIVLGRYFWFLAYSLIDRDDGEVASRPFFYQLGHYLPFWAASAIPIPKGAQNLARIEVKSDDELAVLQLKGLKLLLWATVLHFLVSALDVVAFGNAGNFSVVLQYVPFKFELPSWHRVVMAKIDFDRYSRFVAWPTLIMTCLNGMLKFAVVGHVAIAICRVAGFRALRSTWKPYEARNIFDFWGRTSFYTRELVMACLFKPIDRLLSFLPCRTRQFFAGFFAASLGSYLIYFLLHLSIAIRYGVVGGVRHSLVSVFSSVVFGLAIGLTLAFAAPASAAVLPRPRWKKRLAVFLSFAFFVLLSIFNEPNLSLSLRDYISLFLYFFVIRWP